MNSRRLGVMPPWVHVGFWVITVLLAIMVATAAFAGLRAAALNVPPPNPRNTTYMLIFAGALAILLAIWRRFWFLPSDVVALLKGRGARVERLKASRRTLRARVGDVWLLAGLDRPIRGYWPNRQARFTRGRLVPVDSGLKPDYMLRAARVELARPGDFSRLPRTRLETTAGALQVEGARTGDADLDRALRAAASAVREADMPIVLEVTGDWLRLATTGGSWLGARFGRRIEDLLAFMGRLLPALAGRFTPHDPDAWVIEPDDEASRIVKAREAALGGARWKALPFALLALLPCTAYAGSQETAAAFLFTTQEADGGWSSRFSRRVHTTSEVLRALQELGTAPAIRTAGADFLFGLAGDDVDERARRIAALAGEGLDVAALRAALLAEADARGGWALVDGFAADPLDTAVALTALAGETAPTTAHALGVGLLVGQQNADGGWPCVAGGASEISCSAEVVAALAAWRHRYFVDASLDEGKAYLRTRLNADGSFGAAGVDQTYASALAAHALVSAGDNLGAARLTVLGFFHGRQAADGAWENDALVTAVALRALDALLSIPVCGDGVINLATEACDGGDLGGRSCEALGLGAGTLGCSSACTLDTTACAAPPACGDGVRNRPEEACDGFDLGGSSCSTIGFLGGTLGCNADCTFDASSCTGVPACGDGIVNRPEEECDRGDLAGASCTSLGLLGGSLTCSPSCLFNTSSCTGTGQTEPKSLVFGPESAVCSTGTETRPVSISFPPAAVVDKVDVFLLFDDSGSFAGRVPTVRNIFNQLVTALQAALPGISLGFGVGRFEEYGGSGTGFSGDNSLARPFILNQPIVTPDIPGFATLISNALNRTTPGSGGGDGPETTLDALFRVATGRGFDGNGNGSTLDSGPAGATATQTSPGSSGDVPAFASNVAPAVGTLGGVGFRPRALHLVLVAGDVCSVAAYTAGQPIPPTVTGIGGATVPASALRCSNTIGSNRFGFVSNSVSRTTNTVTGAVAPAGAATVPDTIAALNELGISVIGLADGGTPIRNPVGPSTAPSTLMSALALLTGATDATGNPLVFNISGGTTPLRNAIVQAITTAATRPVDVGARAVNVPSDITATLSPTAVPEVGPGERADFSVQVTGTGVPRGTFNVEFFDTRSNALLGLIPASIECLPIIERPPDRDGDGFGEDNDCNDQNPAVNPGASEIPGNGIDDDCNPATPDAVPDGELTCTVTPDKPEYTAHEAVNLDVVVSRTGGAGSLVGLELAVQLAHAGGPALGDAAETLAPLAEDERRTRAFAFNTGAIEPGDLLASVSIRHGGALVASCSASARLLSSADAGVSLVGTIQADPPVAFFRDPIALQYQVTNQGNAALDPATLEILIVDAATELVSARLSDSTSLAPAGVFDGVQPAPAELPVGEYIVILRGGPANDLQTLATAPLSVRVPPNVAPSCAAASATQGELWPPNHKFTFVGVQGVTDADEDPVTIQILGVTQDEDVVEQGSGKTCPDAIVAGDSVQLRAERAGGSDGRVYRVRFTATDPAGASCTGTVRVCVPHDQSGTPCVESPPVVESTACPAGSKP